MKSRFVSVSILTFAGFTAAPAVAQQAVIPPLVIKDGNGAIIGPVVSFPSPNIPMVRIIDSGVNVPVFLEVRNPDQLQAPNAFTYFSATDCSGNAYHRASFSVASEGMAAMLGHSYSVAKPGGGDQWLYRSNVADSAPSTSYASIFQTDACNNTGGTLELRPASQVINLDMTYPPTYTAE